MLYKDLLATIKECPFCSAEHRCIEETERAYLTFALAPYSKYHLLAIPKRHIESFSELTNEEESEIDSLLQTGAKILDKMGRDDYSVLVRSGTNVGRSIKHLHYHLIPDISIGSKTDNGEERRVLTQEESDNLIKYLKDVKAEVL